MKFGQLNKDIETSRRKNCQNPSLGWEEGEGREWSPVSRQWLCLWQMGWTCLTVSLLFTLGLVWLTSKFVCVLLKQDVTIIIIAAWLYCQPFNHSAHFKRTATNSTWRSYVKVDYWSYPPLNVLYLWTVKGTVSVSQLWLG